MSQSSTTDITDRYQAERVKNRQSRQPYTSTEKERDVDKIKRTKGEYIVLIAIGLAAVTWITYWGV